MATQTPQTDKDSNLIENLDMHLETGTGKRLKRLLTIGIPVALIAVVLLWVMSRTSTTIRYKTQPARRGDITVIVNATGNLQPTNQVIVGSELSGTVKAVEVDYNDQVKIGQVLARLDTSKLSAQVLQSQAALNAARAKVLQTQATIEETRAVLERLHEVGRLSNNRAIAKSDLDAAQAAAQSFFIPMH